MVADVEACKQMYASMMAACYAMGFNPPAFAACAAAAVAAYGACLAANS